MHTIRTQRATRAGRRNHWRHRPLVGVTVAVFLFIGCEPKSENTRSASDSESTPNEATSPEANAIGADADNAASGEAVSNDATETKNLPATVTLESAYYPQEEIVSVALDGTPLTLDEAYAQLVPALVRFIETAGETSYPMGTAVMRPAIHLDSPGNRYGYMLVVGEPAVRYYSPDKSWHPWLIGEDERYEALFQALQTLCPHQLPRGN